MNIYKIPKIRSNRVNRLEVLVQNIVADFFIKEEIITEDNKIISLIVSKTEFNGDLKLVKIFVRCFNEIIFDKANLISLLEKYSSNLHKIFAKKLYIKYVPKVKFYYEDSFDLKQEISEYLKNNNASKKELNEFLDCNR